MNLLKYSITVFMFFGIVINAYPQQENNVATDNSTRTYPVVLHGNLLFQYGLFPEHISSWGDVFAFCCTNKKKKSDYCVAKTDVYYTYYRDTQYVYQGFLRKEREGELYIKYDPLNTENVCDMCSSFKTKDYKKMWEWLKQETKKGLIVSINNAAEKGTFTCKSFKTNDCEWLPNSLELYSNSENDENDGRFTHRQFDDSKAAGEYARSKLKESYVVRIAPFQELKGIKTFYDVEIIEK